MNRRSGFILALATAVLAACAGAPIDGASGDGVRPRDNTHTRAAGVALAQASLTAGEAAHTHYTTALSHGLRSIEEEPGNPRGYLVAGQAAVGLGEFVQADTLFDKAVELYPGYAPQIASEREQGWVNAYNMGIEEVNAGNLEGALALFQAADRLYQDRPEARMNIGWTYMQLGNTEEAIRAYRRAVEIMDRGPPQDMDPELVESWMDQRQVAAFNIAHLLAQAGRAGDAARELGEYLERHGDHLDEGARLQAMTARANFLAHAGETEAASRLFEELAARGDLTSEGYFQIGIGYFNTGDFPQAAEAFRRAAELNPYSRDALLNLVQSLYSEAVDLEREPATPARNERLRELYAGILSNAERVREFDPLNRNLLSFMLRAYRGQADLATGAEADRFRQRTQDLFRQYQQQPVEISDITMSLGARDLAQMSGILTNLTAAPGSPVRVRFTTLGQDGRVIGTETAEVQAPAQEESVQFTLSVRVADDLRGWKYEVMR